MSLTDRIQMHFGQAIETKMHTAELLTDDICLVSQWLINCLVNDSKILCCGNGASSALAQLLSSKLMNKYGQERPGLPAITIGADSCVASGISNTFSFSEIFARQIKAIGQPGDILVIISTGGNSPNIIQAIQAAHDREVAVIALTGGDGGGVATLLTEHDIELRVPSDIKSIIHEAHMSIIHCLCDLIDYQLFEEAL
ncbi:SIS domain-containing protein [Litoribrevibacter euphylliae]|uniref:SIS domain-containing protein n=1 Tax=Litoribrevibacter euphylliae TaxID=1834034 RepID=A0ABV7HPY8_9GAMM